jgi:hypothetical protein
MAQILRAVRRRPLITFFALAYALSWWPWILYAFDPSPQPIVGFGPFLAAVVVLGITPLLLNQRRMPHLGGDSQAALNPNRCGVKQ